MTCTSLRLITYLLAGYLLTSCQARQYGFFQSSTAVIAPADRPMKADDRPAYAPVQQVAQPVADTATVQPGQLPIPANVPIDKAIVINRTASSDQLGGKAEKKERRQLMRSELRAAIKQYKAKPAESRTNGLATASLISGLLAFLLLLTSSSIAGISIVLGPLALILGIVSLGQVRRKGQKGLGLGIAGMVLGAVYILLILLVVAAFSNYR